MTFKIVVTNPINPKTLKQLQEFGDVIINKEPEPWAKDILVKNCKDADAIMVFMTDTINAEFLEACPNLKVIAGALKGYNNIDIDACTQKGITLTIVPDLLTEPTAELTIGLMISVARNFTPGDQYIRQGKFSGWRPLFYGNSINNSTVGIIGAGAVGKCIMRMLKGFNCTKLYFDKKALPENEEQELDAQQATLEQIQADADFVVLAIHLMDDTKYMIDEPFIKNMKKGSYLINPARGSLVNEEAVSKAINSEHLAGYATDTFEMEDWAVTDRPREINSGLISSDKTVLTPHIGSAVISVRQAIEQSAAESLISVLKGQIPETAVNAKQITG